MKYIPQFAIILLATFAGQLLNTLIPLPVPAAIWGMVLLFAALASGILKLEQVEATADFLSGLMMLIFVPFGVNLMTSYNQLAGSILKIVLVIVLSTFVCFFVTGKTADFIIGRKEGKEKANE
ncbi:MAG: CidA/LrgA family protein [Firmicutes bacterium]|nr:CidA/LrgA family protein [Bacillota bacterium]MBR6584075.1 CidA/LrgA family protein [Bacillota bacterium]